MRRALVRVIDVLRADDKIIDHARGALLFNSARAPRFWYVRDNYTGKYLTRVTAGTLRDCIDPVNPFFELGLPTQAFHECFD